MKVDFITFCHPGDIDAFYTGDWFYNMVESHKYCFDKIIVVHQRCNNLDNLYLLDLGDKWQTKAVYSENYPNILSEFDLPEEDELADRYTHGSSALHYWKWHVINHLIGLKVSEADYIVFSDCDCTIRSQDENRNWIRAGIDILQRYPEILIVSPGDGATMSEGVTPEGYRCTQNVSQQLFLCSRKRLSKVNLALPWNWEYLAPGGPMQEYYYMLEGRIWRYMHKNNLWRCILPDNLARYWHHNRLTEDGLFEADYAKY